MQDIKIKMSPYFLCSHFSYTTASCPPIRGAAVAGKVSFTNSDVLLQATSEPAGNGKNQDGLGIVPHSKFLSCIFCEKTNFKFERSLTH